MSGPSGTVTFLFTDIEGSTRLWEAAPEAMGRALERHAEIVRGEIERQGGYVFATGGDGFAAAFGRAADAVAAATAAQALLLAEEWANDATVRVRIGLHTGEAVERGSDYFGPAVNEAARLMAIGHGGQVICSAVTAALLPEEVAAVDLGEHRLRDLSSARRVFQIGDETFPSGSQPRVSRGWADSPPTLRCSASRSPRPLQSARSRGSPARGGRRPERR
jgi:class 3 adenylate cyclase